MTDEAGRTQDDAAFCAGRLAVAHERTRMLREAPGFRCPVCGEATDECREEDAQCDNPSCVIHWCPTFSWEHGSGCGRPADRCECP